MGIHAAGDGTCLYDGQCHPFLRLRDGTHPLAARTCEPRPLAQARQIRPAAPVGAIKPGPGRRIVIKTARAASADSEVRPGPRPPTLRPRQVETGEAGPEALPTSSLPITGEFLTSDRQWHSWAEQPILCVRDSAAWPLARRRCSYPRGASAGPYRCCEVLGQEAAHHESVLEPQACR